MNLLEIIKKLAPSVIEEHKKLNADALKQLEDEHKRDVQDRKGRLQ